MGQDWDGATATDFFGGKMDGVKIWDRALSQEEIEAEYSPSSKYTNIYINLRSMTGADGNPIDILSGGIGTVSLDIRCVGTARTPGAYSGAKNITISYLTTRLPAVSNYSVTDPGEDTTLSITITTPQYTNFITEAQSKSPQVKVFLVHSSVYATYQNNKEALMTATTAQKVYTVPIDIISGAGAVTVTPLMAFTDTGTYYYTARSTATGFTSGAFTTWGSLQVDHLGTAFPTIPQAKWAIDNTGSDPDITVTVNPYSEFKGTSDAPETYEIKVTKGSLTGYAYQSASPSTQSTNIFIDLRNMTDGSGNPIDILSEGLGDVAVDIRCVGYARTPGAYSGEKIITIAVINSPPKLIIPQDEYIINDFEELKFRVVALDINDDVRNIVVTADGLPEGSRFEPDPILLTLDAFISYEIPGASEAYKVSLINWMETEGLLVKEGEKRWRRYKLAPAP